MDIEEKNFGEQPETSNFTLNVEEQQTEPKVEEGSPMGKFKSVEALVNAYQNLEKEFTQKCQKVKELTEKLDAKENMEQSIPEYQQDGWDEKVKNFFESHPMAKNYVAEISEELSTDESVAKTANSLESALTKVLAKKFVPYETLMENEEFLEKYVYQNKHVSEKIIENYLDGLQSEKALPLISSRGAGTVSSPIKKPKTLKDAGKMVEAYLKNK